MEAPNLKTPVETPPELSIVLPAFNEEGNIARAVRDAFAGAAKIPMAENDVVLGYRIFRQDPLARMWFRLRREPNKREAASGSPA